MFCLPKLCGYSFFCAAKGIQHDYTTRIPGIHATVVSAGIGQPTWSAETTDSVPYRTLGRTGEKVSIVGIGGYHLGKSTVGTQESIRIIRSALDEGINFLDNCWDYNSGESEIRMGQALRDGSARGDELILKLKDKKCGRHTGLISLHFTGKLNLRALGRCARRTELALGGIHRLYGVSYINFYGLFR